VRIATLGTILLVIASSAAHAAGPYDGSKPMKCAIETVFVCHDAMTCIRGTAATISFPPVVTVDVEKRVISGAATGRTARITSVGHGNGRMMLHGEEVQTLGNAWNLVVTETSGAMTAAVLSRIGASLLFGTCSAP
jgi:hypothetical protein